jgi:hypothetical protein
LADSYLLGKEQTKKILSEIPSFLEKHGVKTDADTLSKLFDEDKDRAKAHDGQVLKDWAYKPSWRPGTANKLTDVEALSRLTTRVRFSESLDCCTFNPRQSSVRWLTLQLLRTILKRPRSVLSSPIKSCQCIRSLKNPKISRKSSKRFERGLRRTSQPILTGFLMRIQYLQRETLQVLSVLNACHICFRD